MSQGLCDSICLWHKFQGYFIASTYTWNVIRIKIQSAFDISWFLLHLGVNYPIGGSDVLLFLQCHQYLYVKS